MLFLQCSTVSPAYLDEKKREQEPKIPAFKPIAPAQPPEAPHPGLAYALPVTTILEAEIVEETPRLPSDPELEAIKQANFSRYPQLQTLFERHEVEKLDSTVQLKFMDLYIRTRDKKYLPKNGTTQCTTYFYDYFTDLGYGELLATIKTYPGKTMVEKALNYEQETGGIVLLRDGWEAQKLANAGKNVGVIGEYYWDEAEAKYTRHYSVVQPSVVAFDSEGEMQYYKRSGLITTRKDVNGYKGLGTFLAQAGIANGLIDFRWAYNRKMGGILQLDAAGQIRGGILFILFPDAQPVDTSRPLDLE